MCRVAIQTRMLELAVLHRRRLNPPPLPRIASLPQLPPSRPTPMLPLNRPTSFPQAYPTEKEMAEKARTTPADITQLINTGEAVTSSMPPVTVLIERDLFACRSFEVSLDFRFVDARGDKLWDEGGLVPRDFRGGSGRLWP